VKKVALLTLICVTAAWPAAAHAHRSHQHHRHHAYHHHHHHTGGRHYAYHHRGRHHEHAYQRHRDNDYDGVKRSQITCAMVRSYVAQMGLEQAKAMAAAAGITAAEERRARQCLAGRV
jgi:hypothetical protein